MDLRTRDGWTTDIPLDDLEIVSRTVMLRLEDSEEEALRVSRMRELLWAASELTRALSIHTQHALVDCCGSHGTGDLDADARALHRALTRYAQLVHEAAEQYRWVLDARPPAPPAAAFPKTRSRPGRKAHAVIEVR